MPIPISSNYILYIYRSCKIAYYTLHSCHQEWMKILFDTVLLQSLEAEIYRMLSIGQGNFPHLKYYLHYIF